MSALGIMSTLEVREIIVDRRGGSLLEWVIDGGTNRKTEFTVVIDILSSIKKYNGKTGCVSQSTRRCFVAACTCKFPPPKDILGLRA